MRWWLEAVQGVPQAAAAAGPRCLLTSTPRPPSFSFTCQVWIVTEYCNRGSLLDAIDRGILQLPGGGGPDLEALVAMAQEIAGVSRVGRYLWDMLGGCLARKAGLGGRRSLQRRRYCQ